MKFHIEIDVTVQRIADIMSGVGEEGLKEFINLISSQKESCQEKLDNTLISRQELKEMLGISFVTLDKNIKRGIIKGKVKIGRKVFFKRICVEQLLEKGNSAFTSKSIAS